MLNLEQTYINITFLSKADEPEEENLPNIQEGKILVDSRKTEEIDLVEDLEEVRHEGAVDDEEADLVEDLEEVRDEETDDEHAVDDEEADLDFLCDIVTFISDDDVLEDALDHLDVEMHEVWHEDAPF